VQGAFPRTLGSFASDGYRRSAVWIAVALVLLGAWTAWFFAAPVTVYEVSSTARLEVDRALHPLSAPADGVVISSSLALDRPVRAGDVLVELESKTERLQLEEERVRLTGIGPQLQSLRDEIAAEERALADARKEGQAALGEARAQLDGAQTAARFSAEQLKSMERLKAEGQVAEIDYLRARSEADKNRAQAEATRLELERRERDRSKQENERQARVGRLKGELSRMEGQAASSRAASDRLENDIQKRLVRAPADGRIVEVAPLQAGSFLEAGDRIGAVLASGRLKIIASFPAAGALGRVRPGQKARLRLAGFPWMQYGTVPATVANVASEVHDGGIRIELDVLPDPSSRIPLQHGLPGTVEVDVERLTPAALALRSLGRSLSPVERDTAALTPTQ
jgi:multidrug resistance efflux pump